MHEFRISVAAPSAKKSSQSPAAFYHALSHRVVHQQFAAKLDIQNSKVRTELCSTPSMPCFIVFYAR
eukprot:12753133-Alexandrium_andersonii.AAC.1